MLSLGQIELRTGIEIVAEAKEQGQIAAKDLLEEYDAVFAFGGAPDRGSMFGVKLNASMVGITSTADGQGYWLLAKDGGVFSFNAPFYGSTGNLKLNKPVVTSQTATLWWALRAMGIKDPVRGYGRLLTS